MKVLTVKQPWASLIINGYKKYEFRSWKTNYRGKILIHAGLGIDKDIISRFERYNITYNKGAILGEATLTDCVLVDEKFSSKIKKENPNVYFRTSYNSKYAWKLENIKKYDKPIPVKGKLGLWNIELLEVYNENLKKTGEIIPRGSIPKTGYILAAGILIENLKGEYLIQKTSKQKGSEFAVTGGHVSINETLLDCIIRETKEEIGLTLNKKEIKYLGKEKHPDYPLIFNFYQIKKDINLSDLKLQKEEVDYVIWMTKEKIKSSIEKGEFRKTTEETLKRYILND